MDDAKNDLKKMGFRGWRKIPMEKDISLDYRASGERLCMDISDNQKKGTAYAGTSVTTDTNFWDFCESLNADVSASSEM